MVQHPQHGCPYQLIARRPNSSNTVSVLGQREGYPVKYCGIATGLRDFPRAKLEGTPQGNGLYLTIYPELSPNKNNQKLFLYYRTRQVRYSVFHFLRGQNFTVYSLRAVFHSILLRAKSGYSVYWAICLAKRAILEALISNIPL